MCTTDVAAASSGIQPRASEMLSLNRVSQQIQGVLDRPGQRLLDS